MHKKHAVNVLLNTLIIIYVIVYLAHMNITLIKKQDLLYFNKSTTAQAK